MKAKIKYLQYQRNGVMGEPFYHCVAIIKDDISREMLITFRGNMNDNGIVTESCRAVEISNPLSKWRGDEIAYCLNTEFTKMIEYGKTLYDYCTKEPVTKL